MSSPTDRNQVIRRPNGEKLLLLAAATVASLIQPAWCFSPLPTRTASSALHRQILQNPPRSSSGEEGFLPPNPTATALKSTTDERRVIELENREEEKRGALVSECRTSVLVPAGLYRWFIVQPSRPLPPHTPEPYKSTASRRISFILPVKSK